MSQKVWIEGELVDNPFNMTRKDLAVLQVWRRKEGDCPYCLRRLPFDRFATYLPGTKKHPKRLSKKMMECPECHQRFRIATLIKITDMSVEDFSYWFWDNVFLYRMMERVSGDSFFGRIKLWRYEDRQMFWNVYHEYKDGGDRVQTSRDRENYERYIALGEGRLCASCDTVLTKDEVKSGECPQCGEAIEVTGGE